MLVVGIAGKKRSGKDTVAQMLMSCAERAGIPTARRAFADALKEECARMIAAEPGFGQPELEVLYRMHTDSTKEKYRLLLQWWGTEFKRGMVSNTYWLDKMQAWLSSTGGSYNLVVIPDVRFPNEVEMVKQLGGVIINVRRPGMVMEDEHISEKALDTYEAWDSVVINDSDLKTLELEVAKLFILCTG